MSVVRNKRSLSDLEYFHNGLKMRDMILDLLIRDFGVKVKRNDFEVLKSVHNMTDEDMELAEYLCKKYRVMEHVLYNFPGWFMEYERKTIMDILKSFMAHLRYADNITVNSDSSHEYRKYHVFQARADCYRMMDEMEYLARVFPVDMTAYIPFLDVLHYEIKLLNRLEKHDNDKYRRWKNYRKNQKNLDYKNKNAHEPTKEISEPGKDSRPKQAKNPFDDDMRDPFTKLAEQQEALKNKKPVKMIKKDDMKKAA